MSAYQRSASSISQDLQRGAWSLENTPLISFCINAGPNLPEHLAYEMTMIMSCDVQAANVTPVSISDAVEDMSGFLQEFQQ